MGTKNHPGEFDCYAKAQPDEPLFTLLARDPIAPYLVRIWTWLRSGDVGTAMVELQRANQLAEAKQLAACDSPEKLVEALRCADEMERYGDRCAAAEAGDGFNAAGCGPDPITLRRLA